MPVKQYVLNVLIAFDEFVNVLFRGHCDETISARAGRAAAEGKLWGRLLRRVLDWLQPNHCELAEKHDAARADTVEYLETGSK